MKNKGYFGDFGGAFVPEILVPAIEKLESAYWASQNDLEFQRELQTLLKNYAGRPTPLYEAKRLAEGTKARIFLKREDLLHGGAHKTNQVIGQMLLAKKMGVSRIIAETGAGQHGVATAMCGALFGFEVCIYMGAKDVERQKLNVFRMQLFGAKVVSVKSGSQTLKDAVNEALRDWTQSYENTHYLIGTATGPHPFPTIVRDFQKVIGDEAKTQLMEQTGVLPDKVIACVGGGSNAIGIFAAFLDDPSVELIGVEPYGKGLSGEKHGATLHKGSAGILHGTKTILLQNSDGQVSETHSVSAGLDYPGVGPQHAFLKSSGRASYVGATDDEALEAFVKLSQLEGIIPALESAHAVAHALKLAKSATEPCTVLINISGRGDKDMEQAMALLSSGMHAVKVLDNEAVS